MKISYLELDGVRNHRRTCLTLDRVNILAGPNGGGKTTIVQVAIEYALTGRCRWTDRGGRGSDMLSRRAADSPPCDGVVVMECDIGRISRTVPMRPDGLKIAGKFGSAATLQQHIYESLGTNADMISAALNAYQFADLPPKEQSDMLFALAGLQFDGPGVRAELEKRAGCSEDALLVFDALCPKRLEGGAEVFDILDKLMRDTRRDVNRDLKAAQSALKLLPSPPQLPAGVTTQQAQAAKATLTDLAAKERDLLTKRGAADERARQLKTVEAEIAKSDAGITARIKMMQEMGADPAMDAKAADASVGAARAEQDKREGEYKARLREFEAEILALSGMRDTADRLTGAAGAPCPLAPEHLKCAATPDEIAAVRAALEADIARRSAENRKLKDEVDEAAAMWQGVLNAGSAVLDALSVRTCVQLLAEARATREKFLAGLKTLKAKPAAATLDIDLDALRMTQATALKAADALAAVDRYSIGRKQVQDKIDVLAGQSEALDWLVEALGPTGLKAEKLGGLLGELQDRADDRLKQLTGDGLGFIFQMEEGGELRLLVDTGGARLPLSHLSQSERLRAGIALQDVLNSLTGLRIMVIDDCDVLDEVSRSHLISTIQAIEDQYDTIIVIAARSTPTTAPQMEGWRAFWVKDGAAQVVE